MRNPSLDKIMENNLGKTRNVRSSAQTSLPSNGWLSKYTTGGFTTTDTTTLNPNVLHPNQNYISYPGDTLTNNQLRIAQLQKSQFVNPNEINPKLIRRDPNYLNKWYPPQGSIIANMNLNGQPTSDLQDYGNPNTQSSLYKLSPTDIKKMNQAPLGWWDKFTNSFSSNSAELPKPSKKQNGGIFLSDKAKATQFGQYDEGGFTTQLKRKKEGGDISIPDLQEKNWLNKYL